MIAPYRLNLKSKSHWLSHLEGLTEMSWRNYSLKVQTSCFALQLPTFSPLTVRRPSTPSSTSSSPWRWWWRWWPWASLAAAVTWETPGTAWTSSSSWPGERPSRQRRLGWWFRLFVCWLAALFLLVCEEILPVLIAVGFHCMFCLRFFFPFLFSHRKLSGRSTCERELNSHASLLLWKMHRFIHTTASCQRAQNGSRCIAALHIISIRRETSLLCLASIALRAASVVQQAGERKRRFLKPPFGRRSDYNCLERYLYLRTVAFFVLVVNLFCFPLWCSSIMNNSVSCESVSESSVWVRRVTRYPAGLIWRTC